MSNDDSNPNDRSRSWVIWLSKKGYEKSFLNDINGDKAPLSWMKKILPSRMIILMLLGDQLNSTKSQNPTYTGERADDNANNLCSPILSSYWNLIQLEETQVNWEQIYGLPRQQIN